MKTEREPQSTPESMARPLLIERQCGGNPSNYGNYFWCADMEDGGHITFHADRLDIVDGCLVAYRIKDGVEQVTLVLQRGTYLYVYAASMFDGHAVCVDRWVVAQ